MTAQALHDAVEASIDGDQRRARHARRTTRLRRDTRKAAEAQARRRACLRTCRLTHALATLQCLDEVERVGQLADSLALAVVRGRAPVPSESFRSLGWAAPERLRCLAEGSHPPEMDSDYVRSGRELRDLVERVSVDRADLEEEHSIPGVEPAVICAELARAVLAASQYAARAA